MVIQLTINFLKTIQSFKLVTVKATNFVRGTFCVLGSVNDLEKQNQSFISITKSIRVFRSQVLKDGRA